MPSVRAEEFSSRRMAATAATHGVYSSVNTRKLMAEVTVKIAPNCPSPASTVSVLMTAFGHKARDERGGSAPVGEAERPEEGRDEPSDVRKQAVRVGCGDIQLQVERAQRPDDNAGGEDDRKRAV